jgi:hypothetical protein
MTSRNSSKAMFAVLLALSVVIATAARAQPAPGPGRPTTQAAKVGISADVDDKILPEVSFSNVSLDDMVAFLQDAVPNYKAVVFRDPDVAPDVPTVNIRLKGVSVGQLMQLLAKSYPYLEFQPISGAGGTVQLIKVHSPEGIAPSGGAAVKVYALADIVDRLATRRPEAAKDVAAARKAALNDALSLIKVTLSQSSDGGNAPNLQLHEETQTLIFKGNPMQQAAVQDVLSSLTPKWNESAERDKAQVARVEAQYQARLMQDEDRMQEMQKRLADAMDALRQREDVNSKQSMELERLKVRLEEMTRIQDREAAQRDKEQRQPAGKP